MDFLVNLGSNILGEFLFWVGLGLFVYIAVRLTQNRFLDFFGVRNSRRLTVYLSNLWQQNTGRPTGSVLSGHEFRATRTITGLFGDAPFRLPELVKGLVDALFAGDRVDVSIEVSPLLAEEVRSSSMIVVGGTPKNITRRLYFESDLLCLAIVGEKAEPPSDIFKKELEPRVRIMTGPRSGEEIVGDYNFAIIEKVRNKEQGTVAIMCAGFRGDSSWAATEYLARNWRQLARKYGNDGFAICLGFPMSERYMEIYTEPIVVARFPD
jgi:hypothetical protein